MLAIFNSEGNTPCWSDKFIALDRGIANDFEQNLINLAGTSSYPHAPSFKLLIYFSISCGEHGLRYIFIGFLSFI